MWLKIFQVCEDAWRDISSTCMVILRKTTGVSIKSLIHLKKKKPKCASSKGDSKFEYFHGMLTFKA